MLQVVQPPYLYQPQGFTMFKNTSGQYITVHAIDNTTGVAKTGDAANITAYLAKDAGSATQSNDVNPAEISATNMKGAYRFTMTQAETNADLMDFVAVSATANITLVPISIYTVKPDTTMTTQMTEGYAADGVAPTPTQALFRIMQNICEFSISGVTLTTKKIDKSTQAEAYELNDPNKPTQRTRSS